MPSQSAKNYALARQVLTAFTVLWCCAFGAMDVVIAVRLAEQLDAGSRYVPIEATIIDSGVERQWGGSGGSGRSSPTTIGPRIVYEYMVGGQTYTGDTVHNFVWHSSDGGDALAMAERYPAGSVQKAYYDPDDPSRAMLLPGWDSVPAFMLLFIMPFHCVAIGLVAGLWALRPRGLTEPSLRQAIARDDGEVAVLRSVSLPAWGAFLGVLGLGSFLALFPVGIIAGQSASWSIVLCIEGFAVVLGVVAAIVAHRRRPPRVVLNRGDRTVTRGAISLAFEDIVAVETERTPRKWQDRSTPKTYYFTLRARASGGAAPMELVRLMGVEGHAEPLAAWLRENLGLEEAAAEASTRPNSG